MGFYVGQLSSVLGLLHDRHVIYRDLKPENLCLDQHGYLKARRAGLEGQKSETRPSALPFFFL